MDGDKRIRFGDAVCLQWARKDTRGVTRSRGGVSACEIVQWRRNPKPKTNPNRILTLGPDKCGNTNKVHFILRFKNAKNGEYKAP